MLEFVPYSTEFNRDPYPFFAQMREHAPVCKVPSQDSRMEWYVTRYRDIETLLKDRELLIKDERVVRVRDPRFSRRKLSLLDLVNRHLLFRDPPVHTRLRSLVNKAFATQHVDRMRYQIQETAEALLNRIEGSSQTELLDTYAYELPLSTISRLLGVEESKRDAMRDWADAVVDLTDANTPFRQLAPTLQEFVRYLDGRFERCKTASDDGLICQLVDVHEAGDRLSKEELFNMVVFLVVAGFETVVNLIGNGCLALLIAPGQREQFVEDPLLAENAIDEILRYDGPIKTSSRRWAAKDFELHGEKIKRGDCVRLVFSSANRDEEMFSSPEQLDITRRGPRNLAFGGGIHYCLGAMLARIQGQIALETLFRRFPRLGLAADPGQLQWRSSVLIQGLETLPLTLR